ncbi:MAG: patatin-like phospholipase family protein [Chloroflexota bacterium]|nr:patatin-like phospholipase family protein [Chloroflexota bacterium]
MRELPQLRTQPGTCLVLSGGATKAFYFHLGVLKVLGVEDITSIVGSSAGAVMGAFIASGIRVTTMLNTLDQKQFYAPKFDTWIRTLTSTMLFKPQYIGIMRQVLATSFSGVQFALSLPRMGNKDVLAELIDTFIHSQSHATSLFDAVALETLCKSVIPSSLFTDLDIDLYVTATGLDTQKRAIFNKSYAFEDDENVFMTDVPIHKAVRASSSLPGMFEPVNIKGQYYVDGEIKRTLSVDVGLQLADRVIVSHTYQPLRLPPERSVRNMGWVNILKQSTFIVFSERVHAWRTIYAREHPDKEVIWIEPEETDVEFFNAPEFSFRREVQQRLIDAGEKAATRALIRAGV